MNRIRLTFLILLAIAAAYSPAVAQQSISSSNTSRQVSSHKRVIESGYAWRMEMPLGTRVPAAIDTLMLDFATQAVPGMQFGKASAITGNFGAEGLDMIYFVRPVMSEFFFRDALYPYLPDADSQIFYNTRRPMTLLGYSTGGGREQTQDRLKGIFSGNINKRAQVGAHIDYIYSKGSYANQAMKNLAWGVNGSYMGDRYEMQAAFDQFNSLNKENGGIVDDLYITDPAEIQGGSTKVDTKNIPTNLTAAHSRVRGEDLLINNRYKLGFYREVELPHDTALAGTDADTAVVERRFVPVTSFAWTFRFRNMYHMFRDDSADDEKFWENTYLTPGTTHDETKYWAVDNTFGVSLMEGFHKYARFGLSAFIHHQIARYTQAPDTLGLTEGLTPYPLAEKIAPSVTENRLYAGARLSKSQGAIIRYNAMAEVGLIGAAAGEIKLTGDVSTRFRIRSDSMSVRAYAQFFNTKAPLFTRQYVSNHFIWSNEFGKTRRVRFGGELDIPHTGTHLSAGVENVQNLIYFDESSLPTQHRPNIQVFSATLDQHLRVGILNWHNTVTYQKNSDSHVLPMPDLSVYGNLYLLFRIATLKVQLGVDCNYMTRYTAMAYQPATMTFHNQSSVKVGNYPLCNAYINMKLSKVRFYVLFAHVNQGLFGGSGYFSAAHYPLNPRRFQIGLSVDFAN